MNNLSCEPKAVAWGNWIPQLDGLRTIAVTLVFFHHWTAVGHNLGIIGVQLFFVLSGFLITGILLRERREVETGGQSIGFSIRQFYARRFLRIFPLYYFCLLLFIILGRFEIRKTFLWFFFYLSNVLFCLKGGFSGPFSHFWSLAVEEQFYLFWPLVVLLTPRRRLPPVLLMLILLSPLARAATFLSGHAEFAQTSTMVWANLDTLGMGSLLACSLMSPNDGTRRALRWLRWAVPLCVVEVLAARFIPGGAVWVWLDPLAVALVSVWAVWTASTGFEGLVGKCLSHPVMAWLGRISYGLYVWHMFAPAFLRNILHLLRFPDRFNDGAIGFVLLYAWTVAAASLSWFLLEKPLNGLKRYFPYRDLSRVTFSRSVEVSLVAEI